MAPDWFPGLMLRPKRKISSPCLSPGLSPPPNRPIHVELAEFEQTLREPSSPNVSDEEINKATSFESAPTVASDVAASSAAANAKRVTVLLDGDGDFFNKTFLSENYHGGRRAAITLHNHVLAFAQRQLDRSQSGHMQVQVLIAVFCNLNGLGNFLQTKDSFRGNLGLFTQGFNNSPFVTSMVDTGVRKQSADEALKKHLSYHIGTADLVLLGGTHDGGYSDTLHHLSAKERKKVLLLRTTPYIARALQEMGLPEVRFEGVFDGRGPMANGNAHFVAKDVVVAPIAPIAPATPPASPFCKALAAVPSTPSRTLTANPTSSPQSRRNRPALPTGHARTPGTSTTLGTPPRSPPAPHALGSKDVNSNAPSSSKTQLAASSLIFVPASVRPAANQTTSPGSPSSSKTVALPPTSVTCPKKFIPLVELLLRERKAGRPRPLRSQIGGTLRSTVNGEKLYDSFKDYTTEAEVLGLVKMGEGPKTGSEWIEVLVKSSSGVDSSSVQMSKSAPSAHFGPLLSILNSLASQGQMMPNSGIVGEKLRHQWPKVYQDLAPLGMTSFKAYAVQAAREGLCMTGGDGGIEWIALKK